MVNIHNYNQTVLAGVRIYASIAFGKARPCLCLMRPHLLQSLPGRDGCQLMRQRCSQIPEAPCPISNRC